MNGINKLLQVRSLKEFLAWVERYVFRIKTWEEIEEANRAYGRSKSRAETYEEMKKYHMLTHPAAAEQRAAILTILDSPDKVLTKDERARLDELLHEALVAQQFPLRHNTIDEVWQMQGRFDRFVEP